MLLDAIESIPEGFVIYDADDRFVMCNEAYRYLYAENAQAFVPGARYEDIMRTALALGRYPEAAGREEEWLAEWMRMHRESEASTESQLKDGRWVLVSERRMPNGGIAGLRIDITALKAMQKSLSESRAKINKMAEDLERRVEERTRELRTAQDELLKKERLSVLGQLTATVAHELRNPMSAIRNTAYAIREAAGSDAVRFERPLARLERSVSRCETLISELLEFTRPKEAQRRPLRLDDWMNEVLDEQKVPDGIALLRRLGAPGVQVALDAERFRRVVINLIDNAAQAIQGSDAPGGARRITVTTSVSEFIDLLVEDSGPGIPADVLPRVFEPLFSTKSFGTGLGLPTVKQIVEQHSGVIAIASEIGRGTTVHIRLPLPQAQVAVA